jgi:hypothetical protein
MARHNEESHDANGAIDDEVFVPQKCEINAVFGSGHVALPEDKEHGDPRRQLGPDL